MQDNLIELIAKTTTQAYDITPPQSNVRYLFPTSNKVPAWASTFSTKSYSAGGRAELITMQTTSIPMVNATAQVLMQGVAMMSIGYYYDKNDVEQCQAMNFPLSTTQLRAARNSMFVLEDDWCINGLPQASVMGINNHPNIGTLDLSGLATEQDKIGSLWLWMTECQRKTGLTPDTLVLPRSTYKRLKTTFINPSQITPTLDYWRDQLDLAITYHPLLQDALCYNRANSASLVIPRELEIEPPVKVNLKYEVIMYSSFGGLSVEINDSICKFKL